MHKAALNPFEWPEYLLHLSYRQNLHPQAVGNPPIGVRWGIGPLTLEEYRTDTEPTIAKDPTAPPRIVFWTRPTRSDTPPGWHRPFFAKSSLCIGYHLLSKDYEMKWTKTARYYRKKWQSDFLDIQYRIVPMKFEDFSAAFSESTVAKEIPTFELNKLKARIELFPEAITMWGVERIADGKVVAGHAVFTSATHKANHYSCGFYLAEVRKDPVMVGLMDHWFAHALAKNVEVLHFGVFLPPNTSGSRRSKGISHFKAQFITDYHHYQPSLFRFVSGKFF